MISDHAYERLAQQKVSRLPTFSYAGPALHLGKSAVLLGERYWIGHFEQSSQGPRQMKDTDFVEAFLMSNRAFSMVIYAINQEL